MLCSHLRWHLHNQNKKVLERTKCVAWLSLIKLLSRTVYPKCRMLGMETGSSTLTRWYISFFAESSSQVSISRSSFRDLDVNWGAGPGGMMFTASGRPDVALPTFFSEANMCVDVGYLETSPDPMSSDVHSSSWAVFSKALVLRC